MSLLFRAGRTGVRRRFSAACAVAGPANLTTLDDALTGAIPVSDVMMDSEEGKHTSLGLLVLTTALGTSLAGNDIEAAGTLTGLHLLFSWSGFGRGFWGVLHLSDLLVRVSSQSELRCPPRGRDASPRV